MTSPEQKDSCIKREESKNKTEEENSSPQKVQKMETEINDDKSDQYLDFNLITRKWRVKFYKLNSQGQWDDNGIGFVFCASKINESNEKMNKLIMLNELTEEEMFNIDLVKNGIEFNYQRSTIMTWKTEEGDDDDLAISFQEKDGLIEIYRTIALCQEKEIKMENLLEEVNGAVNFLEVSVQNLPNLSKIINPEMSEMRFSDFIKELENSNYDLIIKLGEILINEEKKIENLKTSASSNIDIKNNEENNNININNISDDSCYKKEINKNEINNEYNQKLIYKNLPMKNIHYIFNIFKNLILIGDRNLTEALINDDLYLITFGALEYDFDIMKSIPHRQYFKNIVKFKNPLNIKDKEILKKINQNLRLTYLRDTALSRLIEDNAVKTINTILQYNHNDIIQFFLNNTIYLEMLLDQLKNEDLDVKKEACLFLSELIEVSKDVPQTRTTFSEQLFDEGILKIIGKIVEDNLLNDQDNNNTEISEKKEFIKITAVEIFIDILSSIPNVILDYLRKENDNNLLKLFTNIMLYSDNFGIKYEICQIYKTLIETQLIDKSSDRMLLFSEPFEIILKYLNVPLSSYILNHKKKIEVSSTKQIIIEILMTWFSKMNFNKQFWIESNKLDQILTNLLIEDDKIINLYTIKLLKCLINYTDPFICNKILTEELCNNLIVLFSNNVKKNNIIISSMMDFFDSLSQNKEMTFNNAMIFLKDFCYNNKKKFEIILMRYEHQTTPKKILKDYIRLDYKDYKDPALFLGDWDYKFSDILEDEDKTIDYLSKKRERSTSDDDLVDNNVFENYSKKYGSNNEYSHKINNKKYEMENEDGKSDDNIFKFDLNNINQNNEDGDEDEDNNYYHIMKK